MSIIIRSNVSLSEQDFEKLKKRKEELAQQLNVSITNKDYVNYLISQDLKKVK